MTGTEHWLDVDTYLQQTRDQTGRILELAETTDHDLPVAACPDWNLGTMLRHLAAVQGWVLEIMRAPSLQLPERVSPPRDWAELAPWWRDVLTGLLESQHGIDPLTPCAPLTPASPQVAYFWIRRMAHEAAMHRLDVELAAGTAAPSPGYGSTFAADGVDEVLALLLGRDGKRWEGNGRAGRVLVHCADGSLARLVTVTAGQLPNVADGAAVAFDAEATIAGTADAVYRALWGREHGAAVSGDTELAGLVKV